MNNKFKTIFLMLVTLVISSTMVVAGPATIVDGVLKIPYTNEAPVIDGQLDGVWNSVTATPMLLFEGGPVDTMGIFDDHYTNFRTLWDDDYFYVFVQVVDDELDGSEKAEPWNSDAVEIFFDGQNEKATSYDANDIQWRWVYGEIAGAAENAGNGPGDFVFFDTESGYNLELRIPSDSLANIFPLEADHEIGFEISNADRDNGAREDVFHWWTTDGTTWNNASLFGTALLGNEDEGVSEVINIPYTDSEPTIDGVFEEDEGWEIATELTMEKMEGDALPDTLYDNWKDHLASFYTMWDENNFYVFVKVIDEELDGSEKSEPWNSDAIELFFDGQNEKATSYDANDVQWRWVYGEEEGDANNAGNGPGSFVFNNTDLGYNLEISIPKDSLANIMPLSNDHEFGFEISNADRDNGARDDVRHWWTTDGTTWNNASLFGTALLTGGPVSVEEERSSMVANKYELSQNYPNPFNPTTKISYSITEKSHVNLAVYNIIGQEVAVLVNGFRNPGSYTLDFNAENFKSGVYFYKLRTDKGELVRKMTVLK